jgi:tetratricopeptide (TPR) repeat protein
MRLRTAFLFFSVVAAIPVLASDSAEDLIERGHYKRAEAMIRMQLQQNPDDPLANCLMSKIDVAFSRYDEAIAHAEKAVAADNGSGKFHAQLEDALGAKTGDPKAGMFQKMSVARRMRQEAEIALKLDPKNMDANEDLLEFYLEAPGIAGGGKDKARDLAVRATQSDPKLGYYLQAQVAQHEKHTEEAQRLLQQVIQADVNYYNAHVELADVYLNRNPPEFSKAEEQARQAMKIEPLRIGAYASLTLILAKQGRWKEFDQALADGEKNIPDNFAPHYQAGKAMLLSGDAQQFTRAEACFRKYLTQEPEGGTPPLAAAHWRLGQVLEKEGRKDEARSELQAALKLDPNLKEAQQDLKRLR